jgi:hypothetical protein
MPKPSVGRVVHYVSYGTPGGEYGQECRAAIVTEVSKEHSSSHGELVPKVGLCVLNPTGLFLNQGVQYDGGEPPAEVGGIIGRRGGTWHWPERVE